jgi:hypothetical protein
MGFVRNHALDLLNRARPDRRNRVHMISVLMDDNLEEIAPLTRLCREIGGGSIQDHNPAKPSELMRDFICG